MHPRAVGINRQRPTAQAFFDRLLSGAKSRHVGKRSEIPTRRDALSVATALPAGGQCHPNLKSQISNALSPQSLKEVSIATIASNSQQIRVLRRQKPRHARVLQQLLKDGVSRKTPAGEIVSAADAMTRRADCDRFSRSERPLWGT